jgi:hypothetical protein
MLHPPRPTADHEDQRNDRQQYGNKRTPGIQRRRVFFFVNLQRKLIFRRGLLIAGCDVIGYCLVFIESEKASVGADEPAIKNPSGKEVEFFVFESLQPAFGDLGGFRDFPERYTPHLSLASQFVPKNAH